MTPRPSLLIFDFDGTLADTSPLIVATMQATIAEMGLPPRSDSECRATIGLRLEDVPRALWPAADNCGKEYAATYRHIFNRLKTCIEVRCYPGVIDTLRSLRARGFAMAIASSRNRSSLVDYAAQFDIASCFDMLVGGDDVDRGKPAPDPVLTICRALGFAPEESLVIGDAVFDILMGRNAGATTCAVTYGNQSRAELLASSPSFVIDNFADLLQLKASTSH